MFWEDMVRRKKNIILAESKKEDVQEEVAVLILEKGMVPVNPNAYQRRSRRTW